MFGKVSSNLTRCCLAEWVGKILVGVGETGGPRHSPGVRWQRMKHSLMGWSFMQTYLCISTMVVAGSSALRLLMASTTADAS